ncbi:MAG: 4Fe-4S dicluster domain-containing protein [Verrucomicrobiales bacterium]
MQKGSAVVVVGSRHGEALQQLAVQMNRKLGAFEKGIVKAYQTGRPEMESLAGLAAKVEAGEIENLVLLTPADPVYDAAGFADLLGKVKTSVQLGTRTNATAWAVDWHLPAAHYLESWSDAASKSGVYSLLQPLILPLYGGISELDFLHAVLNGGVLPTEEAMPAMAEVKKTFAALAGGENEAAWKEALKEGFYAESGYKEAAAAQDAPIEAPEEVAEGLELLFASDASVWDGRYIDNVWLQEAPDPVTKLTWDNAATVSPQTAKDLGIYDHIVQLESKTAAVPEEGEGEHAAAPMVSLKVGEKELQVPVLIGFGQADGTISLPVGYGQAADDGRQGAENFDPAQPTVGDGGLNTGFNAYRLRDAKHPYFVAGVSLSELGEKYPIARTQDHHSMYGRALAREISTNEIDGKGDYATQLEKVKKQGMDSHAPANVNIYKPKGSKNWHGDAAAADHLWDDLHQWGMTIDLNSCTGCNACLVACQAENNIPVVGKEQLAKGREMHWIRMDRYYASYTYEKDHGHYAKDEAGNKVKSPEWVRQNPEMIPQPVACVQCEQAPCETVCPVNATVHTEEGLNSMAYNRCIGTRYCANNCPYKARRFNFFDYNKRNPLVKKNLYKGPFGEKQEGTAPHLQRNPNVTVRMRGVMEKCTYCVQRLEGAKIKKKQQVKFNAQAAGVKSTDYKVDRVKDLRLKEDAVEVACQSACESGAITFGNLLDKKSKLVRAKNSKRNYDLLNYLNTRPRTSYLARVKNPNENMPDAKYLGQATIHVH